MKTGAILKIFSNDPEYLKDKKEMSKEKNKKKAMQVWKIYQVSGDKVERKTSSALNAEAGFFWQSTKTENMRKCGYSEFTSKK